MSDVLFLQVTLADLNPLREATGWFFALWLILGGGTGLILLYGMGRLLLRERTQPQEAALAPSSSEKFTQTELNRYARHIVLRELGGPGQKRLKNAKALVIGAGGLGVPVLQYLTAGGVGTLGVIDDDVVENANLQRQVIFPYAHIGMPKVFSAQQALEAQNPHVTIRPYHRRLTRDIAAELFAHYDLILDGTDNFDTRYLVNKTAVETGKPLISGALTQWEGQISVFAPAAGTPCYHCIFPQAPAPGLAPSCAALGVLGPLPGVIGSMMAVEAIKWITGAGTTLANQMLIYDALYAETRTITLKRRANCPVCGNLLIKETQTADAG